MAGRERTSRGDVQLDVRHKTLAAGPQDAPIVQVKSPTSSSHLSEVVVIGSRGGPGSLAQALRPRQWSKVHEDKGYHGYVRQIREIFEAKGVLVAH